VRSVEAAKLGYDLDCADDRGLLHVEVKGVSGAQLSFPITRNEVETAARDPYFSLAVVTSALTAPRLHFYSSAQFRKRFLLTPISFMAKAK
jgi:hypothetical protein